MVAKTPSHPTKRATRNCLPDEERRKIRRTREKQRIEGETPERKEMRLVNQRLRMRVCRAKIEAEVRRKKSERMGSCQII